MSKSFSEMTQVEIEALSKNEFDSIPLDEKRNCYDCDFRETYASHWCVNKEASLARGTHYAGIIKCPYWKLKK